MADLTGATPVLLQVPGLVGSASAKRTLMKDPVVTEVMAAWSRLTLLLVGIGSLEPSPLLKESGNAMTAEDQKELRDQDAVGDICLRYFDSAGKLVRSEFDQRVLGLSVAQVRSDELRSVGVAGGMRQDGLGGASDLDRRTRLLDGRREDRVILDLVEAPLE